MFNNLEDMSKKELFEVVRLQCGETVKMEKEIEELKQALSTSFEFLSLSGPAEYYFFVGNRHLVAEKTV